MTEEKITKESVDDKAIFVFSYDNGDWAWMDEDEHLHLIRNGVELTKGIKAKDVHSYDNGEWKWKDEAGKWHTKGERTTKLEKHIIGDNKNKG